MIRFDNKTGLMYVDIAAQLAEGLLLPGSRMMNDVAAKNDFKFDSGAGINVYLKLTQERAPIYIKSYKSKLPWSKAIGYYDGKAIYINSRKATTGADLIGLLVHEYSHHAGFKHGNNYKTKEKCLYSVPYYLSENIGRWL